MEQEQLPQEGDQIGQYQLIRLIGIGGMGIVYEARDGEERVAVKLMPPNDGLSPEAFEHAVQRMEREASVLLPLRHANLVRVRAFGWRGRRPWFAMELIQGQSFNEWMASRPEPLAVVALFRKLASGLRELHRLGLVHRDIKPSNVMVRPDGEPVLLDFGIVQSAAAPTLTTTRELLCTRRYASPELAAWSRGPRRSAFRYTPAYDVHGLGVMLYEALTGTFPFTLAAYDPMGFHMMGAIQRERPRHPSELAPQVPRPLGELALRMLAKNPASRPDSSGVEAALSVLVSGGEPPAWRRRARTALSLGLVGGLLALAVVLVPRMLSQGAPPVSQPVVAAVDARPPAPQPAPTLESPAMSKPLPPAVTSDVKPKPAAPAPKPARKSAEPQAVLLLACATAISACHADVRPGGSLADCPPRSSEASKRLGIPAGYEFHVQFLDEDEPVLNKGWGPPRVGLEHRGPTIRVLLPINQPVRMRFAGPEIQPEVFKEFGRLTLPPGTRVFGLAKQGPKRVEITFTRLVLKDGSEYPICAVAYDGPSYNVGKRGLPTPLTPPVAPPDSLFIDTAGFTAHVLEPF